MVQLSRRSLSVIAGLLALWAVGVAAAILSPGWLAVAILLGIHLATIALVLLVIRAYSTNLLREIRRSEQRVRDHIGSLEALADGRSALTAADLARHEEFVVRHLAATRARLERHLDEGAGRQHQAARSPGSGDAPVLE